jgi:hypothetical protein
MKQKLFEIKYDIGILDFELPALENNIKEEISLSGANKLKINIKNPVFFHKFV